MTRAWWLALVLAPGGLLVAPALWLYLRWRERNRVAVVRPPSGVVDLDELRRKGNAR